MDSLCLRSKDHPRSGSFEPVTQFDVFHAVNLKVLVKAAHVQKYVRRSGYVAGVVVGKIDRPLRRGVRIKNTVVPQISQERIGGIAPRHADGADNGRVRILLVAVEMRLNQQTLRLDVVIYKQDDLALRHPQAGIASRRGAGLLLETESQIGVGSGFFFEDAPRVIG